MKGRPYTYWERLMPRIPNELFSCVVFLYPSQATARKGRKTGATGFVVALPNAVTGGFYNFLITNTHVLGGDACWVRVNTSDGGADVFELPQSGWVRHEDGDDVAATLLEMDDNWELVPLEWDDMFGSSAQAFADRLSELNFGVGDDAVMVGRFVGHDGSERNLPLARFGNVAMMPWEPVLDGRGLRVDAFLVEMRSLPGFSGSPVFVYIGPGSDRANGTMMPFFTQTIGLIGIDTGHKRQTDSVYSKQSGDPINIDWEVRQNSGVAIVSPSWKIEQLLNQEEFVPLRKKANEKWREEHGDSGASSDLASDDEPEMDRFTDLARKIVHVTKSEIDEMRSET